MAGTPRTFHADAVEPSDEFYAIGYSINGEVWQELPLDTVSVTRNHNAPDTATVRVVVDERWGEPTDPRDTPPDGLPFQLLQPWSACIAVFDRETDAQLFYGPVVKRRREATTGTSGFSRGSVEIECRSWEFWLEHVYPEFNHHADGSAAESAWASTAVKKVIFGVYNQQGGWPGYGPGGDWVVNAGEPNAGTNGDEWQRRGSVAGKAGAHFGFMPIMDEWITSLSDVGVYLDWDTNSIGNVAQTSAWKLIEEVLDQGSDFFLVPIFYEGSVSGLMLGLEPTLDWGDGHWQNEPFEWLVVGGEISELSLIDRGDLYAQVVHVTAGSGDTAAWPKWADERINPSTPPMTCLVERKHPYQKNSRSTPIPVADLEGRARVLLNGAYPSPVEVTGVKSHDRLPNLLPGEVVSIEVPVGMDPGSTVGWTVKGRVQSITWTSGEPGCTITLFEPGAGVPGGIAQVLTPSPVSFPTWAAGVDANVTTLRS